MSEYFFGIDIGGTAVKIGLFRKQDGLISKWEIPTRTGDGGSRILPDIVSSAGSELSERGLDWSSVAGIGFGIPGLVLDGYYIKRCVNLGWDEVNIREEIRRLTGVENVSALNDAKAAALGEWWKGGHGYCRSAVMITIGTGIGGGVILDGKIVTGAFGAAGELSHFQIDPDETEPCACGKYGHLQQYASAEGIVHQFQKRLAESGTLSVLRGCGKITAKDIFDAAKNGDGPALETVSTAVKMIARTMAMISTVIDPELFLIGGGVSKAGDFLLDAIRAEYRRIVLYICESTRIEAAALGNDAGIYGAVKPVMDRV